MTINLGSTKVWLSGLAAAGVSGAAGGVLNAFAAIGIKPDVFNLSQGLGSTMKLAGASALISAIIGVSNYLKQSPVPPPNG